MLSQENKLYAGGHGAEVDGRNADTYFVHASFLRGAPVFAAGEIGVDHGKLVWITPKSGHYKPEPKEMLYFLKWLKDNGVNLSGIGIKMNWSEKEYYDADQVLTNDGRTLLTSLLYLGDYDRPMVWP